jgi:hypothetical protein
MRWFALLLIVACGSDDTPTFETDVAPLVAYECVGCHAGEDAEAGLDLYSDPWGVLVDGASAQSDLPLVAPGDALQSYVWHKVNGTQVLADGAGSNMPLGRWLTEEEIARIGAWIDAGALE